jgi:Flp pilus assembly protein TadG
MLHRSATYGLLQNDQAGTAAIEMAIVAPVFFLLSYGIVEIGILLFGQAVLDNATRDAARAIQIGSVQAGNTTVSAALCHDVAPLLNCSRLEYNLVSGSSFASLTPATITSTGDLGTQNNSPGGTKYDVLLQVSYRWPFVTPIVVSALGGSNVAIVSTTAFQNEPF